MKKILITLTIGVWVAYATWVNAGPQLANTEYYALYQGFAAFPNTDPYELLCGYNTVNQQGVLCLRDVGGNFHDYTADIPPALKNGYAYTDIIGVFEAATDRLYITGYKITALDKRPGIIFRCNFDPYGTVSPWGFQDLTGDLPVRYPSPVPPILSIDYSEIALEYAITGAEGMILWTPNFASWTLPLNKPVMTEDSMSAWYKGFFTNRAGIFKFTVIDDHSGKIAWTQDWGITPWTSISYPQPYSLPEGVTLNGFLTPLSLPNSYFDWQNRIGIGLSMGQFAIENEAGTGYDIHWATTAQSKWWWFHGATGADENLPGGIKRTWFCGSDGGIVRYNHTATNRTDWERFPENTFYYNMTSIGGYTLPGVAPRHNWAVGDTLGRFLYSEQYLNTTPDPPNPSFVDPTAPQNFAYVYDSDPNYYGWRFYWDPPSNADTAKIAGYWVCPPEPDIRYWVMNKTPVPRTTYFWRDPPPATMNARVCAMRRDGTSSLFTALVWHCAIDAQVERDATGGNNGARNLLLDNQSRLWSFYGKDGNIYATYTTDQGEHYSTPKIIGEGDMQAAAINASGNPVVIRIKNEASTNYPFPVTARIYVSSYTGLTWVNYLVKEESFYGNGYIAPSLDIDKYNQAQLTYEKFQFFVAPYWTLYYGTFPLSAPENSAWAIIDYDPLIVSPIEPPPPPPPPISSAIGIDSDNCPHIVWNKWNIDSLKYTYRDTTGQWAEKQFIARGWSPSLEMKGDIASVAYTYENGVWYITGGKSGFSRPRIIYQSTGYTRHPVIVNNYVVWEEQVGDLTDLYYSYLGDDFSWAVPGKLFGYPYRDDRLPQIEWVSPYLCAAWTQRQDSNYILAFERKEIITPAPDYAIDLGQEVPSPITVERDGFIEYGTESYMTVDYDSNMLVYHITGIESSDYKWRIKFVLYHEGNDKWKEKIKIDDGWTRNKWVYPYQVTVVEGIIPEGLIKDGAITITVEVAQGELAILSDILLKREPKGQGGGPQSSKEIKIPAAVSLNCLPNPTKGRAIISYALPYLCEVKLAVYNALGQLVRVIEQGKKEPGFYTVNWDNQDANYQRISNGIYFFRLETPSTSIVKKVIVLK